jgi:tRNA1Val (adenine37-N6)-methyltransferase
MPNTYFQFKAFIVHQEKTALKVSTDSCLFGAWVANELSSKKYDVSSVLDIGTGTGLLMLMLVQKHRVTIDGIEIDKYAYEQAKNNIEVSVWNNLLRVFHGDVKTFAFPKKYDLIISNPPFFEGDLKSAAAGRNVAMHDEGLKLKELLKVVASNLNDYGFFAVLLPYRRADMFIEDAKTYGLYAVKRVNVKQTVDHSFFRAMILLGREEVKAEVDTIVIKDNANNHTGEFIRLLKDYYLYL